MQEAAGQRRAIDAVNESSDGAFWNSRVTSVVSGDRTKRAAIAKRYRPDRAFEKAVRPNGRQRITRPGIRKPALIKVQSATED